MFKITDEIKEDFQFDIILCAPAYTLEECLKSTAHRKYSVFERNETDDIDSLVKMIKENFRAAVFMLNKEKHDFLKVAIQMTEKKEPLAEMLKHQPLGLFTRHDYLFLYLHGEQLDLVMPEELIEIYRFATAEETFTTQNERNLKLYSYACALLNIYGIYEATQFVTVWNQHNKDKIEDEQAEKFLIDRMNFHSDYWIEDDFVIHDCL